MTRILSLVVALFVTVASFVSVCLAKTSYIAVFPRRYSDEPSLVVAICLVAAAIYLLRRHRDVPVWILLIGSSAFLGWSLHDSVIDYGLQYRWFGFWPLRNPLIRGVLLILQAVSLLTFIGIFWLTAQFVTNHLTKRWS